MGPELWVPTATLLIGGALGYFGKRIVEKTGRSERLDRAAKLVALHGEMKQQGLTTESLNEFESALTQRRPKIRAIEDALIIEIEPSTVKTADGDSGSTPPLTQADMTAQAFGAMNAAQDALKTRVDSLLFELEPAERERLTSAQKLWTQYAESQSDLFASLFDGGSMQPMMMASELDRLTIQRLAELKDYQDARNL